MAIRIERNARSGMVSAADLQPGALIHGVLYSSDGQHVLSSPQYYVVTHTRALVSLPDGHLTTSMHDDGGPVKLADCMEFDGTLIVTPKVGR